MTHWDNLVAGLKLRDEEAWREFMTLHGKLVLVIGRRLGLGDADSEDLFQTTCVTAYGSIENLRDPERLTSWVYSIAHRQALDLLRLRRPEISGDPSRDDSVLGRLDNREPSAPDLLIQFEDAQRVRTGLESLDLGCRRLLSALYLEDPRPSYEEISSRVKTPIGSIGPTRARCLEKLKRELLAVSGRGAAASTGRNPRGGDGAATGLKGKNQQ